MKMVRTHPPYALISVRGLVFIYLLLCTLTILFSRIFFAGTLREGAVPGPMELIVFFTIPAVLLIFLAASLLNLFRDLIARRAGSKFQARLFAYFIITVVLAAVPATIIITRSVYELIQFWRTIEVNAALSKAQDLMLDKYAAQAEKFESLVQLTGFEGFIGEDGSLHTGDKSIPDYLTRDMAAVQDFTLQSDGTWENAAFAGIPSQELKAPPSVQRGFVSRDISRDRDMIRFVLYPRPETLRVASYSLGEGFDAAREIIAAEQERFSQINSLGANIRNLLIFYYGVFFSPTLLMTAIIAISFTRRVTQPIAELTEATGRVAEGDFSIQILARPEDELGLLIRSFNAMVQDLEKSRSALVRAEKISIWQTMAQQLAHEIKNPLTPIKLSAERVLRRWRNDPQTVHEILESSMLAVIQEVEGLSALLTEFRTLSKPIEPSPAWTNLRELAEETIVPYQASYPQVRFDISHIQPDMTARIDKRHIAQALTNLIINAVDAMNGQGLIEFRTDLVKKRERRYCRLSIRDTGKGISEEEGERIFTPYYTTKESGTGLGLPIVERIVSDHGGSIWFNSKEGMGATFFIDLPIDERPHALITPPSSPSSKEQL